MPGYRGRLINPFTAVIERLDTIQTRANTLGGAVAAGYDDVFREPNDTATADARIDRRIRVPCQVEDDVFEAMRMTPAGENPQSIMNLVFHFCDLEKRGLVDGDGLGVVKKRDRLVELLNPRGRLAQRFRDPPGMYATHAKVAGFGIGGERNLWIVTFEAREIVPPEVR